MSSDPGLFGKARELFDRVFDQIGTDLWEPNEPSDAEALADAWAGVKTAFEEVRTNTNLAAAKIFADWPDANGLTLKVQINQFNAQIDGLIAAAESMRAYCQNYAAQIYRQRAATIIEMTINAAAFAASFLGGPGGFLTGLFVRKVASMVLRRVITAALSIAVEAGEEFVISAGAELASINAGYDKDGFGYKQVFTDTTAGAIGGVLGGAVNGGSSALKNRLIGDRLKPDSAVGQAATQHLGALAKGGAVNSVVSPVSSTAAQGIFDGRMPSVDEFKKNVQDNWLTAGASGAIRSNGVTLGSQLGHTTGVAPHVQGRLESMVSGDTGAHNGNTPPPNGTEAAPPPDGGGPGPNTPASVESGGAAGQGATGAETGGAAGQTGPGAAGATEQGASGAGQGATGQEASGADTGGRGTTGAGTKSVGAGPVGTESTGTPPSAANGTETTDPSATGGTGSTTTGAPTADPGAGPTESQPGGAREGGTDPGAGGETGTVSGSQSAESTTETGAPAAAGTTETTTTTPVAGTTTGSAAPTATQPGHSAVPGRTDPAASRRAGAESTTDPAAGATTESGTTAANQPGHPAPPGRTDPAATSAPDPVAGPGRPAEITETVWQQLAHAVRAKIDEVFTRQSVATSPKVRDAVAELAGLDLDTTAKLDITGLAGRIPAGVLAAVVDIAKLHPAALSVVIPLAAKNLGSTNKAVREIAAIVRSDPSKLAAHLEKTGLAPTGSGTAVPASAGQENRPPRGEPWSSREAVQARAAAAVRDHVTPGLRRAAAEAVATFEARPADQRLTGERKKAVEASRAAAKQATRARRDAKRGGAIDPVMDTRRRQEETAWERHRATESRMRDAELRAIVDEIVRRDHDALLGPFARDYRLRATGPDVTLEQKSRDGTWHLAHTVPVQPSAVPATPADPKADALAAVAERVPGSAVHEVAELMAGNPAVTGRTMAGLRALVGKLPPHLADEYTRRVAEAISGDGRGRSLPDLVKGMNGHELAAFGAVLGRLATRPSQPGKLYPTEGNPVTPAAAGAIGAGKGYVQESGDIHQRLDRLARLGVDVAAARKAVNDDMKTFDDVLAGKSVKDSKLKGSAQNILSIFAEVEAASVLAELHPALLEQLGLTGLTVTGVRIGHPDVDVAGRLADGREVRIEVKDYNAFTTSSSNYTGTRRQVETQRGLIEEGGLVLVLLTNDQMTPAAMKAGRAVWDNNDVAAGFVEAGADMVLRYDGFSTFSVLAERGTAADTNQPPAKTPPATPARTDPEETGKRFHREADGIRAMLDRLAERGVDIEAARIALLGLQLRAAGLTSAPELDARGLLDLHALVDAALSLTNLDPVLPARMGLPGLEVRELTFGPAGMGIAGRVEGGREVRVEVRDRPAFTTASATHQELADQLARHREQVAADGLVVTLLTDDQPAAADPAVRDDNVPEALIGAGADTVLRYDGFDTFVVLAQQRPPVDIPPPSHLPLRSAPSLRDLLPLPASLPATTRALLLTTPIALALNRAARLQELARATLRGADRYAGMTRVVPPSGDDQVHRITYGDKEFAASVRVGELDDGVAARYRLNQGAVEITVSSLAAPASVPALVAGALAEAAAELTGSAGKRTDYLVKDSGGARVLSRSDHGRAAQLLAYSTQLAANPLRYGVRRQLKALIEEMGLDPSAKGLVGRRNALPDQRMRDALDRYPELGGPPTTLRHLARNAGPWGVTTVVVVTVAATAMSVSLAIATAMTSVSLGRLVATSLYDRSTSLRDDMVSDQHFAAESRALTDENKRDLGVGLLRMAARRLPSPVGENTTTGPDGARTGRTPMSPQFARISGLRQYMGALGGAVGLGAAAALGTLIPVFGGLTPLAAVGILASSTVSAMIVPLAVARAKNYTLAWKTGLKAGTRKAINEFLAEHRAAIIAHSAAFDQNRWHEIAAAIDRPEVAMPALNRLMYWFSDGIPGQAARLGTPKYESSDRSDPTRLAEQTPYWVEHLVFRSGNMLASLTVNLVFKTMVLAAEQKAGNDRKVYDQFQEAKRDLKWFADRAAGLGDGQLDRDADPQPLAKDGERPDGQPKPWPALLADAVSGALAVGVAVGVEKVLGVDGVVQWATAGAFGPMSETLAGRRLTANEHERADAKAEVTRANAADDRDEQGESIDAFLRHLHEGTASVPSPEPARDAVLDRILADTDRAYRALVDEARQLVRTRGASFAELGATLVDRIHTLHDVAVKAGKLADARRMSPVHRQPRVEVAARNGLVLAIQNHNVIATRINQTRAGAPVPLLSAARLIDGVHAGNTDRARLHERLPELPVVPAGVDGQVAAVTMDQRFGDPGYRAPDDVATWSGNEGWAARVAAAAGVPDRVFTSIGAVNDIVGRLRQLGAGGRAIVHALRKDADNDVVVSGDLVNAVNIGGEVYFIDAVTGAPADMAAHVHGFTVLITEDNGERAATVAEGRAAGRAQALATRLHNEHQNLVPGSFMSDPAAPGLPGDREHTAVSAGFGRIASVINPARVIKVSPDMPAFHAYSDLWEFEKPPPSAVAAAVAAPMDFAAFAVALLDTFGGPEFTGLAEYRVLTEVLRGPDLAPGELFDAMTALMDAVRDRADQMAEQQHRDTVEPAANPTKGHDIASSVDISRRGHAPGRGDPVRGYR